MTTQPHTTAELTQSFAWCERLARREARNFYHAFRVLPSAQRQAMCALYAFLRLTDDLSDGPGSCAEKRELLDDWQSRLDDALNGKASHPMHPAFRHTANTYGIPRQYFDEALNGVRMDLDISRYRTFDELYRYCYRVASVVGLACIHIWGFEDEAAKEYAEKAGIAFQLTNILRDLMEDIGRDRVYLPQEDLERFRYGEEELRRGDYNERFRSLMRFEVDRARRFYIESEPLSHCLQPAGRAVFRVMSRTYRGLLEEIERRAYDVLSSRVQLSRWQKIRFTLSALPVRWGWFAE
ncbi:MAG: phytoene desaturase [Gemmatales bacterium]|nr:MAG: phytoene desaturase [Gemmatales bacterium]